MIRHAVGESHAGGADLVLWPTHEGVDMTLALGALPRMALFDDLYVKATCAM
jgi:hypothetical protein